jgi:signal transduction histidine kinase
MERPRSQVILAVLAGLGVVAIEQLVLALTPVPLFRTITPESRAWLAIVNLAWIAAYAVDMVRHPDGRLWRIMLASIAVNLIWVMSYIPFAQPWLEFLPWFLFGELWVAIFVHLVLAYPSGRLADPFDKRFVPLLYGYVVGIKVVLSLFQDPVDWDPLAIVPAPDLVEALRKLATVTVVPIAVVLLWELARHWRRAGPTSRRILLPIVIATPVWVAIVAAGYFADAFLDEAGQDATHGTLATAQGLIMPLAILIGGLRTRLARANVADLAMEIGHGVPVGGLGVAIGRALRDPSVRLLFPSADGEWLVDAEGRRVDEPSTDPTRAASRLERDGELLAVLVHDPASTIEDPDLIGAVTAVASMTLANERLSAQVRAQLAEVEASRTRIIEATDEERRRLERDLHDGAQQRLVALAMRLQLARDAGPISPDILDAATAEIGSAVREVRDLARGMHPTILTDAGLGPAVEALAERTPLRVSVDLPERRFPPSVEMTAYYVIAETLTNVTKHAEATEAVVAGSVVDGRLVVTVSDSGRGGADTSAGTGLQGLGDRVAAIGGRFEVTSRTGLGTTVRAILPLGDATPQVDAALVDTSAT